MTKAELNQLYWLNKEAAQIQRELSELQQTGASVTQILTGMPRGSGVRDKVAQYAERKLMLEKKLEAKLFEIQYERGRLEDYIGEIEDSETRLIARLRHVNGLKWHQIAAEMGYAGGHREATVRKKYGRFLQVSEISE